MCFDVMFDFAEIFSAAIFETYLCICITATFYVYFYLIVLPALKAFLQLRNFTVSYLLVY